jgi:hypothetical protein
MFTHCFVSAFHGNQNKTSATYYSNKHTPAVNGPGMYTLNPLSTVPFRRLLARHLIKKFPVLFGKQRLISRVHKGPQPNPTLNYKNPTHASSSYSFTTHFSVTFRARTALFWIITHRVVLISCRRCGTACRYGTDRLSRNVGNKLPLFAV